MSSSSSILINSADWQGVALCCVLTALCFVIVCFCLLLSCSACHLCYPAVMAIVLASFMVELKNCLSTTLARLAAKVEKLIACLDLLKKRLQETRDTLPTSAVEVGRKLDATKAAEILHLDLQIRTLKNYLVLLKLDAMDGRFIMKEMSLSHILDELSLCLDELALFLEKLSTRETSEVPSRKISEKLCHSLILYELSWEILSFQFHLEILSFHLEESSFILEELSTRPSNETSHEVASKPLKKLRVDNLEEFSEGFNLALYPVPTKGGIIVIYLSKLPKIYQNAASKYHASDFTLDTVIWLERHLNCAEISKKTATTSLSSSIFAQFKEALPTLKTAVNGANAQCHPVFNRYCHFS